MNWLFRLFSCSHYAVVENPDGAWMGIAKCVLRSRHKGPHVYPFGMKETLP